MMSRWMFIQLWIMYRFQTYFSVLFPPMIYYCIYIYIFPIYMLYTCYIHVIYMLYTCCIHVIYIVIPTNDLLLVDLFHIACGNCRFERSSWTCATPAALSAALSAVQRAGQRRRCWRWWRRWGWWLQASETDLRCQSWRGDIYIYAHTHTHADVNHTHTCISISISISISIFICIYIHINE